jgi:hypothetical protein
MPKSQQQTQQRRADERVHPAFIGRPRRDYAARCNSMETVEFDYRVGWAPEY